eukprot:c330_g1_i1 orf=443-736(+)
MSTCPFFGTGYEGRIAKAAAIGASPLHHGQRSWVDCSAPSNQQARSHETSQLTCQMLDTSAAVECCHVSGWNETESCHISAWDVSDLATSVYLEWKL